MTPDEIAANKRDREAATAILELCHDMRPGTRFWELIAEEAARHLPRPAQPASSTVARPMDEDEAERFERATFPRGQHEGQAVGDVSCGYILWWTEGDPFTAALRRYAASWTFMRRQEEEDHARPDTD